MLVVFRYAYLRFQFKLADVLRLALAVTIIGSVARAGIFTLPAHFHDCLTVCRGQDEENNDTYGY